MITKKNNSSIVVFESSWLREKPSAVGEDRGAK